ncbi:hypothetical protein COCOBI_18-3170 [Coccomyxa sp. Obi]|nr:hypothetical protein COCOBI_18-3170 [Coccomyxa sp. Obi]
MMAPAGVLTTAACLALLCLCSVPSLAAPHRQPPYHGPPKDLRLPSPDIPINITAPLVTFNATALAWNALNETLLKDSLSLSAFDKSHHYHPGFHFPRKNLTSLQGKRGGASFQARPTAAIKAAQPLDAPIGGASTAVVDVGFSNAPVSTTLKSFTGASAQDAIDASNYEQPPDQAICVSPDWVYEVVNGVVTIYYANSGNLYFSQGIAAFFQAPGTSANFVFDPRCHYDQASEAVFFVAATFNPNTNGLNPYFLVLAVNPTAVNPLAGATTVLQVSTDRNDYPVTGCVDSDGNPVNCPVAAGCDGTTNHCWGDYPMMAVDASFVWVTTNIFTATANPSDASNYVGSMAFAISKAAILASAPTVPTFLFDLTSFGFSPQPAITQASPLNSPYGSGYPSGANSEDVMYFTTDGTDISSNTVVCIAAIPSASNLLQGGTASLVSGLCRALDFTDVGNSAFVPTPNGVIIGPIDSRMQQTPFMKGTLWGSLNSVLTVGGGPVFGVIYFNTAGLAFTGGAVTYTIGTYGYLGLTGASVSNPSVAPFPDQPTAAIIGVGVTSADTTNLTFGYSILNTDPAVDSASTIHLVSTSGYLMNDGVDRYGDYTATTVAPDGSVWTAGMSSLPTTVTNEQENWNTWITQVILPPTAICATSPLTLQPTTGTCSTIQTATALTTIINDGSISPGFTPAIALIPPVDLTPGSSYTLDAGKSYAFTLLVSNPAGQSSCQTTVAVAAIPGPTAVCNAAVTYNSPDGSPVSVSSTALLTAIDNGSHSNGGDGITKTLSPAAPGANYSLPVGSQTFTLSVSNCAGNSTCTSVVTVLSQATSTIPITTSAPATTSSVPPSTTPAPPTIPPGPCNAVCKPAATLAAQSKCLAQPTTAQLLAAIDNGSSGNPTVLPVAPSGGYDLPVGRYNFTLSCNATNFCTSFVTVADQEALSAASINCGSVPANGVLVTSALTKYDTSAPAALYVPSYTKANGCPANATASGLSCNNCILGASSGNEGRIFNCAVNTQIGTNGAVSIGRGQIARVAWTVTAADAAGNSVTGACAVCVDHGRLGLTTPGSCPRPFNPTTPCVAGHL